ncbi:MBOAT family protein [Chitinophaga sp. XS-30]|uniref:MBOAT family O-acyltransferase n=1 Tax=Chitinophaga sp. XS-30 TaxID=2604421 RepID=UPI0011DD23EC|nr:MBOAT family O-acyltransferase [Chitinophaga sp. XS-30]QEH39769.1 MBOAT family protein [Chitinophaga sp. XS-30]
MLFNSFEFALFLPIVFILYWFVARNNLVAQNWILLVSSFVFYGWWDYRFLFLLGFSIFLDYFTGLKIENALTRKGKRNWLYISVFFNLGFLGFFKYYNFFIESFAELLSAVGLQPNVWTLQLILPIGISFYTFHGLSYVFDIYNGKTKPTYKFVDYAVFVSFFPLLVAGPIERATHLLPQVSNGRQFNLENAVDGLRQILWGLFKKIVIADGCAIYVNMIFGDYANYNGSTLFVGAILFAFQIYGDFSGYSDIALGVARLFGFELLKNFAYPYFSRDIAEFWRRWHISLSTWFKDYVYIPLGGSKVSKLKVIRNTFIIFLLSGFWHGANWTFIFWGGLNAMYFLPLLLFGRNRTNLDIVAKGKLLPSLRDMYKMGSTFLLVALAWIFFRSENLNNAFAYVAGIFSPTFFTKPEVLPRTLLFAIFIFIIVEWQGREQPYAIATTGLSWHRPVRWFFYCMLIVTIIVLGSREQQFIYFQF